MSLRRIGLRDFVIVRALELDLSEGFSVLTGETGAGKSILIDALQLALGARAEATVVREGAPRADISAEFDSPPGLAAWLVEYGLEAGESLRITKDCSCGAASMPRARAAPGSTATLPRPASCAKWASSWWTSTDSTPGKA